METKNVVVENKIAICGYTEGNCSEGDSCSVKPDMRKKGGEYERERTCSASPGQRSPRNQVGKFASTNRTSRRTSPPGKTSQLPRQKFVVKPARIQHVGIGTHPNANKSNQKFVVTA